MENRSRATLDDVLTAFVAENEEPTAANLQTWVERYPQYRRELVDFAAAWAEQLLLPPAPEMEPETEKVLIDRAMSYVHTVAYERDTQTQSLAESGKAVHSLTEEARRAGLKPQDLANALGLDLSLVSKLNNRQITEVPALLVSLFGQLLQKPTAAIEAYFDQPPQAAVDTAFLAHGKPASLAQQNFADAVRASSLSVEEKARWLGETPNAEG